MYHESTLSLRLDSTLFVAVKFLILKERVEKRELCTLLRKLAVVIHALPKPNIILRLWPRKQNHRKTVSDQSRNGEQGWYPALGLRLLESGNSKTFTSIVKPKV
jgi:hypothetical protein